LVVRQIEPWATAGKPSRAFGREIFAADGVFLTADIKRVTEKKERPSHFAS
jgi:hypothetical protein